MCQWLKGLNMEQYIPEFTARDIDGEQLLLMDGTKLKVRMVQGRSREREREILGRIEGRGLSSRRRGRRADGGEEGWQMDGRGGEEKKRKGIWV